MKREAHPEMPSEYTFYAASECHPGHPPNGDHFRHRFRPEDDCLVLAVSDGVSSHDHDWLASRTTCETCIDAFGEAGGKVEDRLVASAEAAHGAVQDLSGQAEGAMATLILAAYQPGTAHCVFLSVGDSRAYRVGAAAAEQITVDDAKDVVIKRAGELVLQGGSVASRQYLTQAIGQMATLEFQIQTVDLEPGELLVLATDGCYEMPAFLQRIEMLQRHVDLESAARTLIMDHHADHGADDGTVGLIRCTGGVGEISGAYLDAFRDGADLRESGLIGHVMATVLLDAMVGWAEEPAIAELLAAVAYLDQHDLHPDRAAGLSVLECFRDDGTKESLAAFRALSEWVGRC